MWLAIGPVLCASTALPASAQSRAPTESRPSLRAPLTGVALGPGLPFVLKEPEGWVLGWYTESHGRVHAHGRMCVERECPSVDAALTTLREMARVADPNAAMARLAGQVPQFACVDQPNDLSARAVLCRRLEQRLVEHSRVGYVVAGAARSGAERVAYRYETGPTGTRKQPQPRGAVAGTPCFGPAWEVSERGRWMAFDPERPELGTLCEPRQAVANTTSRDLTAQ